jgi:hypothetical protein
MKKIILLLLISFAASSQNFNFQRSWGTYFGDERFFLSDSKTDHLGNLYIVGKIYIVDAINPPVFNFQNSHQPSYGGGVSDGFIAKFNPLGQLVWASYFGGENEDDLVSIDIDSNNIIYLLGYTTSTTGIASANCYQPSIAGGQDFIIARMLPNGSIDWSSYYGGGSDETDIIGNNSFSGKRMFLAHDNLTDFYIAGYSFSNNLGTPGVFQEEIEQSKCIIAKFSNLGNRLWATYYNSNNNYINALQVSDNALYVRGRTFECFPDTPYNTYYGTPNAFESTPGFCISTYLSKFNFEGQREWSTYYGGTSTGTAYSNSIETFQDKVYISGATYNGQVTTAGAFQETTNEFCGYLTQFDQGGRRIWGTFNGFGSNTSNGYGTRNVSTTIDEQGNVYMSGTTGLDLNIATTGAYQENITGIYSTGFVSKFDASGQKIWGTYYGGNYQEFDMICHPYANNFYLVGSTSSTQGMSTPNSLQPNLVINNIDNGGSQNIFIAHFEPSALKTTRNALENLELYPNPNKGNFSIKGNFAGLQNLEIAIYDNQGRTIYTKKISGIEDIITVTLENKLQTGMYFVKVFNLEIERTIKMMVR